MNAPSAFVSTSTTVRARLDEALAAWLGPKTAAAREVSAEVGAAAECVERLSLRGGKRVRAALVGASYLACGGSSGWADVLPAMIAIELLQTYLLIHDDWMDDDDVRRGGPSVHVALREALGSKALGDAGAVLAGDLASAFAQEALLETSLPPERVLRAARTFASIQEEVVIGQLSELRAARGVTSNGRTPAVEEVHARKTASYTVTGPLALGAVLAGADDARVAALGRFGLPLGVAFQLRDDLLGVFGVPSATGKPIWNDIRQGKRTALVAELGESEALARVLGRADASHEDLEAVVREMETSGARRRVEARVGELLAEARAALEAIDLPNADGKELLRGAIAALGERSS